jgi:hypothetical protein
MINHQSMISYATTDYIATRQTPNAKHQTPNAQTPQLHNAQLLKSMSKVECETREMSWIFGSCLDLGSCMDL